MSLNFQSYVVTLLVTISAGMQPPQENWGRGQLPPPHPKAHRFNEIRLRFDQGHRIEAVNEAESLYRESPGFGQEYIFFAGLLLQNSEFVRLDAFEYENRQFSGRGSQPMASVLWHCRRNDITPDAEWLGHARASTQTGLRSLGFKKSVENASIQDLTDYNDFIQISKYRSSVPFEQQYQKDYVQIVFDRLPNHPVVLGFKMEQDLLQKPKKIESALANYHAAVANRKNLPEWKQFFENLDSRISRYLPRKEFKRTGISVPLTDAEIEALRGNGTSTGMSSGN